MLSGAPPIQVESLTKVYGRRFSRERITALRSVSLTVERGEIFGLLGPNGAGKTTLVKILLGVVRSTDGTAELTGVDVRKPSARRTIGFLPENHRFPDFLTASQLLNAFGAMADVSSHDRRLRIPVLLERVRMSRWANTKISKFSKGMMQRLGIAQALINDPEIVFLDEPTDGVDPVGRREIRDILSWLREDGKTVFLNSHLLSEVEQVCTRVAILDDGRVAEIGTVESLTAAGSGHRVVCHAPTPVEAEKIARLMGATAVPGHAQDGFVAYDCPTGTPGALDMLIDTLREAGISIHEIAPGRQTLEDHFIQIVTEAETSG
jgi:ABC-2 type transport system ATP-binding protein